MTLGAFLFLVYLFIFSDIIASAIGSFMAWRYRRFNGVSIVMRAIAVLLAGLFVEGMSQLVANAFGYTVKPVLTLGYGWSYWIGRGLKSAALWAFVITFLDKRSNT